MFNDLLHACMETAVMVLGAGSATLIIGLPLGLILYMTRAPYFYPCPALYKTLSAIINAFRSTPFVILMIAIIPFTRFIVGTSIGTAAATVSLSVAAIPFFARVVDTALHAVPSPFIEAGRAMGATPWQIIRKIVLPEANVSIIHGFTLTVVNIVGYSAMAGVIGGGGLGSLAIHYGYQRFDTTVMVITVAILIAIVQCIQLSGDWAAFRWGRGTPTHNREKEEKTC